MSISLNHTLDKVTTNTGILISGDTGGIVLPNGDNTAQKPSVINNNGLIRYNTTNNKIEAVINGVYVNLALSTDTVGFVSKSGDTMTGSLAMPSGTAASPSLTFSGNTTCGLFNPSTNIIAMSTSSAERLRIDNLGNILFGITSIPGGSNTTGLFLSPNNTSGTHSLYVKGYDSGITINGYLAQLNITDGALVGGIKSAGTASSLQVGTTSNSPLSFLTNNTERMRVSANGGLSIGSTSITNGTILDLSGASNSMLVPIGATGSRPTGVNGMIRYNNELNQFEGFANSAWGSIGGGSNFLTQTFVSTTDFTPGSTTQITLTVTPSPVTKSAMFIFMDGVFQNYTTWTLTGAVITFDSVIPLGVNSIQALWVVGVATPMLTFNQGSDAAPGLAVLGNPSTGFFQDTINTLGLSTNGVSALFIDSSGNIGMGTKSPVSGGFTGSVRISRSTVGTSSHLMVESDATAQISLKNAHSSSFLTEYAAYRSRGTTTSPTTVLNNDVLVSNNAYAYDGSSWLSSAQLEAGISGTVATNVVPSYIRFLNTSPTGIKREVFRINPDGTISAPYAFANTLSGTGYQKLPGGIIIQWSTGNGGATSAGATVTFPIAFPTACLQVVASDTGVGCYSYGTDTYTTTNFKLYCRDFNGAYQTGASRYIAIGY